LKASAGGVISNHCPTEMLAGWWLRNESPECYRRLV